MEGVHMTTEDMDIMHESFQLEKMEPIRKNGKEYYLMIVHPETPQGTKFKFMQSQKWSRRRNKKFVKEWNEALTCLKSSVN